MSVHFYTQREFPQELRQLNGYGEGAADVFHEVAEGIRAASPWDFLTGIFVDKPRAEAQAQIAQAEIAAQSFAAQQQARQETLRTVLIVGAGLVGVLTIVVAARPRKPKQVAGYRRRRARR